MKWREKQAVIAVGFLSALGVCSARGDALRIVSYNVDCADQSSDNNITGPTHSLSTIIQGIGLHHLGSNAQAVDVLALEEVMSTTLASFTTELNAIYGAGTYAYDATKDPSTGGGADGLIYNTHTVQVVSARALKTGQNVLLQSDGTYTAAFSAGGGTNGVTRAPLVYQLRPLGRGTTEDFYLYVDHARSSTDNTMGDARYAEAQAVRSDAKYKLPAGAHIIYSGDWNFFKGSGENAYKCLTGQLTSDSIDWSDGSAIWANTYPTQACDPTSRTVPPTSTSWSNVAADNATYLYDDSTTTLVSRLDVQLVNASMLFAYNSQGGVQLAPDTSDPFDSANFPSSRYPYAVEVFGNNGTTTRRAAATSLSNHSLDDLLNTTPNAPTVYADLQVTGTGDNFTGSDHYPIIADYNIVPTSLALSAQVIGGASQVKLTSIPSTGFEIEASTDLHTWTRIGSGRTDANGVMIFPDPNASLSPRFYRAVWP